MNQNAFNTTNNLNPAGATFTNVLSAVWVVLVHVVAYVWTTQIEGIPFDHANMKAFFSPFMISVLITLIASMPLLAAIIIVKIKLKKSAALSED